MKITVKPINAEPFVVEGNDYKHVDGIHYLVGQSFPDSIVMSPQDVLAENLKEEYPGYIVLDGQDMNVVHNHKTFEEVFCDNVFEDEEYIVSNGMCTHEIDHKSKMIYVWDGVA